MAVRRGKRVYMGGGGGGGGGSVSTPNRLSHEANEMSILLLPLSVGAGSAWSTTGIV